MTKTKTGGVFKFHPFIDNAFVNDIQVMTEKIGVPRTNEQRVNSMTWCDVCEKHSAEAILGDGIVDFGSCSTCGMEQYGFHDGAGTTDS